ncbi:MAG: NADH dehydrogenase (quinone) subunit D, partial [bacterium]
MTTSSHDLLVADAASRAHEAWSPEAAGDDRMIINLGPQHPSTHGVLRVVLELEGEQITRLWPDIGFLHRGDEKIAENMTYQQFLPYTDRLDYLAPMANNVAYAYAVEKLLGVEVPPRCHYIRVICCELSRIASHLLGLGCYAMDVGAMTVFLYTMREREKIMDLFERLSGARYTSSYTRIGGLANDLTPDFIPGVRVFLADLPAAVDEIDGLLTRNRIFVDRTRDVGVLSREQAIDLGVTGPNLRASGVDWDLRKAHPYSVYGDFEFEVPLGSAGDCYDRFLVRMEEVRQSRNILLQAIDRLPAGPWHVDDGKVFLPPKADVLTKMEPLIHQFMLVTEGINAPPGEIYFSAENPKGELGFTIVSKGGGVPHRLKIRAPSFVNLQALSLLSVGHLLSDMTAILGSL